MQHLNVVKTRTQYEGNIRNNDIGLRGKLLNTYGVKSSHVVSIKNDKDVVIYSYDDRLDNRLRFFCATNTCIKLTSIAQNHTISYSVNGTSWQDMKVDTEYSFDKGYVVFIRGEQKQAPKKTLFTHFQIYNYEDECIVLCNGNISYLLDHKNPNAPVKENACYHMFEGCTALLTPPQIYDVNILGASCYEGMFIGCTNLEYCPDLFAETLSNACYKEMFKGCTSLKNTPFFPAAFTAQYCYQSMFENCTGLKIVRKIDFVECANSCCMRMFYGCTGLVDLTLGLEEGDTTILPSEKLGVSCYERMFQGCSRLITIPQLPASYAENRCYYGMFANCVGLRNNDISKPAIVNLCQYKPSSCEGMFSGCSNLINSPILLGDSFNAASCCKNMFSDCTNLKRITSFATKYITLADGSTNGLKDWTYHVPENGGTFVCTANVNTGSVLDRDKWTRNNGSVYNGIPKNWAVNTEYINYKYKYLCICATNENEETNVTINMHKPDGDTSTFTTLQVSFTFGLLWQNISDGDTIKIPAGQILCVRNTSNTLSISEEKYVQFSIDGNTKIFGTVNSLINNATRYPYCFTHLFMSDYTIDASELIINGTLAEGCCSYMFAGCSKLISAPQLLVTTVPRKCYSHMFDGCEKLVLGSNYKLYGTSLGDNCYEYMFYKCTSLLNGPQICATTIGVESCTHMFDGCTNFLHLNISNTLDVTILAESCYSYMFNNCKSIKNIPVINASQCASYCCSHMFDSCTGITVFEHNKLNGSLAYFCYDHMFANCTSLATIANDALPKTTLTPGCYSYMFENCRMVGADGEIQNLSLPATVMKASCYEGMFYGCTNIIYGPSLAHVSTLAEKCFANMFTNCSNLAKPVALPGTNVNLSTCCYQYMFANCDVLTIPIKDDNIRLGTPTEEGGYECAHMFEGCKNLSNCNKITFTSTVKQGSYSYMFKDCISITTLPVLPAPTLKRSCYEHMFDGCTALVNNVGVFPTTQSFPAFKFEPYCCSYMFANCINLTNENSASGLVLNITSTAERSCEYMFYNCSKLTDGLGITFTASNGSQIGEYSFYRMFDGCPIKICGNIFNFEGFTLNNNCLSYMFYNSGLMTAPNIRVRNLSVGCCAYMFAKCRLLTNCSIIGYWTNIGNYEQIKVLPEGCYKFMYSDCVELKTPVDRIAPIGNDETREPPFGNQACYGMFNGCRKLTNSPILGNTNTTNKYVGGAECFVQMFKECRALRAVALGYKLDSPTQTIEWLRTVASVGQFGCGSQDIFNIIKRFNPASGVPFGWNAFVVHMQ